MRVPVVERGIMSVEDWPVERLRSRRSMLDAMLAACREWGWDADTIPYLSLAARLDDAAELEEELALVDGLLWERQLEQ